MTDDELVKELAEELIGDACFRIEQWKRNGMQIIRADDIAGKAFVHATAQWILKIGDTAE